MSSVYPRFCLDEGAQRQLSWTIYNILQRKVLRGQKSCESNVIKSNTKRHHAISNTTINTPCPSFLICVDLSPMIEYREGANIEENGKRNIYCFCPSWFVLSSLKYPLGQIHHPPAPAPHVERTKENPTLKKSALGCIYTENL